MDVSALMTRKVVTVPPDMPVATVAALLVDRRLSAVPVVDSEQHVLGIVSEGDLMRRPETGTERHRSWFARLFAAPETAAEQFVKSHGLKAKDVMTAPAITIAPDASIADAAELMERARVKRIAVTVENRLVGIIARADLVRALATAQPAIAANVNDHDIRERLEDALERERWVPFGDIYVTVLEQTVHLWGTVRSAAQMEAIEVLARGTPGVRSVKNHLTITPSAVRGPLLLP
jgi:CBS domain-containing protein